MDEAIDDGVQPRCPKCGTVLRDHLGGYRCETCNLFYLAASV